jgi:hypothetical protein
MKPNENKTENKTETKYLCSINFKTSKNFTKLFQEKKFLRIITINNMKVGENNIFIICDNKDVEASISELNLSCNLEATAKHNQLLMQEELEQLRAENKRLKSLLTKIKNLLPS